MDARAGLSSACALHRDGRGLSQDKNRFVCDDEKYLFPVPVLPASAKVPTKIASAEPRNSRAQR